MRFHAANVAFLIGAFDAALSRTAAAGETDSLDEALSGPAPTDQELAQARHVTYPALQDAMREALSDALTREQAAQRLGVTPQAVSKRIASGGLVALRRGRTNRLPAWQFHEDRELPGLKQLIAASPGGALSLTHWATSHSPDLDDRDQRIADIRVRLKQGAKPSDVLFWQE